MKKIMSIIICSSLVLALAGCGTKQNDNIVISEEVSQEETEIEETKESEEILETVTDEQKEQDLATVNEMLPIMDSIMLCMLENGYEFDTSNTSFVWNVMAYYVGNYLTDSDKITFSEDYSSAILSKEDVFEYMKGYVLDTVPPFEEKEDIFLVTENEDSYSFGLGDRGLSKSEIVSFSKNMDDSFDVEVRLIALDDDSEICTANFRIESINDETKYFPMVITEATIQRPQPAIQIGTIVEINEDNVVLEVNGEKKQFLLNKNSSEQIKTKTVGSSIDIMTDEDIIINILN